MHEANFTQQIIDAIMAETHRYPGQRPTRIKVRVGEMLHLNPESVQTHFASITRGGPLEKAALELEEAPVVVRCRYCRTEWRPEDHHFLYCDACAGGDIQILSGNAITVDAIRMEK